MSKLLSGHFTEHQYLQLSNDITLILVSYPALHKSSRYVKYVLTNGWITEWIILYNQLLGYWLYDSTHIKLTASDVNKIDQFIESTRDLFNLY